MTSAFATAAACPSQFCIYSRVLARARRNRRRSLDRWVNLKIFRFSIGEVLLPRRCAKTHVATAYRERSDPRVRIFNTIPRESSRVRPRAYAEIYSRGSCGIEVTSITIPFDRPRVLRVRTRVGARAWVHAGTRVVAVEPVSTTRASAASVVTRGSALARSRRQLSRGEFAIKRDDIIYRRTSSTAERRLRTAAAGGRAGGRKKRRLGPESRRGVGRLRARALIY